MMINKFSFHLRRVLRGLKMIVLALAALTGLIITTASPARADWTENRGGCSYTCHWYITSGTCKGPLGVSVPCPVKKKRCSKDFCTQSSE
jgi:hypothetical protein